ncbi:MAG: phytase [Hyphomonadaceae bacterium]|nr:phytase [Hyphomonadaceae bacterium]
MVIRFTGRKLAVAFAVLASAACAHGGSGALAVKAVPALVETPPVGVAGDAADDPAIWVAPSAADSRVIGTQKQGGYYVYDLEGRIVQELMLGLPNNVDLAPAFAWPDGAAPIVAASDRADNTVPLFRFDPVAGRLETQPRARIATGFAEVYGVCIGTRGEDTILVATSKIGEVVTWRVAMAGDAINATRVGGFALGSITEGCVIDGSANALFVAQELKALWRVALDDADGAARQAIAVIRGDRALRADLEGVALWEGPDGGGYIVMSVQGRSTFAVYDRAAPHAYRGSFSIVGSPGVDAVTGTDGLAITSAALGPRFPRGLLVVQDDSNTQPAATQNFKYVSWADVESALGLGAPPAP